MRASVDVDIDVYVEVEEYRFVRRVIAVFSRDSGLSNEGLSPNLQKPGMDLQTQCVHERGPVTLIPGIIFTVVNGPRYPTYI